jgi:predicted HicB family RNase H-like nuclease
VASVTVTLAVPPRVLAAARTAAAQCGLSLEPWIAEVIESQLAETRCRHAAPEDPEAVA